MPRLSATRGGDQTPRGFTRERISSFGTRRRDLGDIVTLFAALWGAVAEFERDLIKERTLDGLERARRAGTQLGRPSVLDRQTRSRIQRLQRSGHTVREIAEKVDLSVGTVHKALHL